MTNTPLSALLRAAALAAAGAVASASSAQHDNPVYVDHSPAAWELFQQASDQAPDNAAEAVRLLQELLDESPHKLLPVTDVEADHFTTARHRVLRALREDPDLLERYRNIESARAARLLEAGRWRELARSRPLTRAGLDALLRVAQEALEEARFHAALGWLEEARTHPDLDGPAAAHAWFMTAMARHYLSDTPGFEAARSALRELGPVAAPFLERCGGMDRSDDVPTIASGMSTLDPTGTADLTDLVAEEIWSVPLVDSLLSRRFTTPAGPANAAHPGREQHRQAADLLTVMATVAGSTIYVNQGHTILALDRFTGRIRWSYVDRHRLALDRDTDQKLDVNVVTVQGDALVTLTGHASADGRSTDGRIICLDTNDGQLRWAVSLDGIGGLDEHDDLFPHGRPIVAEGTVFVLARKVTRQLLTSCYVVALDLGTGELLWSRYIASSGGLRRSARSLSTLVYTGGDVYVSTAVGAIAALQASTGSLRWLRRYHVPISPTFQDQNRRPWELPAPAITEHTVVAVQPDQRRVVVLDRRTGDQLASYPADTKSGWNAPRYLLANEHSIYAIGQEVLAFRHEDLDRPVWRLPRPAQSSDAGGIAVEQELEIRGRVQLAAGSLLVPTLEGLVVVDAETGLVQHRLAVRTLGNPLALESQLLVAGSDRLDAFMSFQRAEQMLRRRIADDLADPEAALSLLRLGARAGRMDLALEAAELTRRALQAQPGAARGPRQELFELLLRIDEADLARNRREGEELHSMIGIVALEPEQRVEHLLAYGRWLSQHALGPAVERYQMILGDRRLRSVWRSEEGVMRTAAEWTARRLAALVREHGDDAYAPQEDFAELHLARLVQTPQPDDEALLALAAEFPLATAAERAALRASEVLERRGDRRGGLGALLGAYRLNPTPQRAERLLGRFVQMCLDAGWEDSARLTLDHVLRAVGDVPLATPQGARSAAAWRAALDDGADRRLPRGGEFEGVAQVVPGQLVPVHRAGAATMPTDLALLQEGPELRLLAGPDLAVRWRATLPDPSPQLLRLDRRRAVLWFGADPADPQALVLDATTGDALWSTPPLSEVLGPPDHNGLQERGAPDPMPGGEPLNPLETVPLLGPDGLALVRRTGAAACFDLEAGAEVRWSVPRALDEVHLAMWHDAGIVLAGRRRWQDPAGGEGQLVPRIVVLDPADGRVLQEIRPVGRAGVRWMTAGPLGVLVAGTGQGIEAIDLLGGGRRWANLDFAATDTNRAWMVGDHLIIEDRDRNLRTAEFDDGVLGAAFELPDQGSWDPLDIQDLRVLDGTAYVRYRQRVVRFDQLGRILGADIVTDSRDYRWLLPVEGGLLVVSRYKTEQAFIPDRAGRRTQHTYRIYGLSTNCMLRSEYELPNPISQRLMDAAAVDGHLLLSTRSDTLVVPMPEPR